MMKSRYGNVVYCSFVLVTFGILSVLFQQFQISNYAGARLANQGDFNLHEHEHHRRSVFDSIHDELPVPPPVEVSPSDLECTYWNCINPYICSGNKHGRITAYVYDAHSYIDSESMDSLFPHPTTEFVELLYSIMNSKFYTDDPAEACLFVPSVDLLARANFNSQNAVRVLHSLPYWNNGTNHLLFTMLPGTAPDYSTTLDFHRGKAIIAGAGFSTRTYRKSFDVSIPTYNSAQNNRDFEYDDKLERPILLLSTSIVIYRDVFDVIEGLSTQHNVTLLRACSTTSGGDVRRCDGTGVEHSYPEVLTQAKFCLLSAGRRLATTELHDVLRAGCVPVLSITAYVMPFSEILDWKRAAVFVEKHQLGEIIPVLEGILSDFDAYEQMREQCKFFHDQYFSSLGKIALTTLQIINDRVFPYRAQSYKSWNRPPVPGLPSNPFFVPLRPSQKSGFTALILTYNRVDSVKQVVATLLNTKGVAKILIIWNNQEIDPPSEFSWPDALVPVQIIQTDGNRLSNRFYPYSAIETDCVLNIDDDITMIPPTEFEFAYRVWSEFPDRLVGFPPRSHAANATHSHYDSEWSSNISMVLTGAAFYHKYYHYLYTSTLPSELRNWVDEHMNCEDIAFNFMIGNITAKAPIKVLARKKFRSSSVNLSNTLAVHLVARSTCLERFREQFHSIPLHPVEFRADPVLYKQSSVEEDMKLYPSDGEL